MANIVDFETRYVDKTINRWSAIDVLSDINHLISPYNANDNNPLRFIDPSGMDAEEPRDNFLFSDGYGTQNYRNTSGNISVSGTFDVAGDDKPKVTVEQQREKIAQTAEKYVGRTEWAKDKAKENVPKKHWKCSLFCYDILTEAGVNIGLPNGNMGLGGKYPYTAGEWGDPNFEISEWEVVETPQRGDVAAYRDDNYRTDDPTRNATGHVGIYLGNGIGVWANESVIRRDPISVWEEKGDKNIIYRRFVGSQFSFSNYYSKNPLH